MASNPIPTPLLSTGRVTDILGTVTGVIAEIESLIAATGLGGSLGLVQIEQLTALFGNLAGVAIRAAHDVLGKPVTPESVLALLPTGVPLVAPQGKASPQS